MMPRANIPSNSWRAILSRSGGNLRGREATGGPLVGIWWVTVCFTGWFGGGGQSKHGNSARRAVKSSEGSGSGTDGLGEGSWVRTPWTCSWVRVSTRQWCLTSTNKLKWPRRFSSQDGVLHVRDNEGPLEGLTESQVQAEGAYTVGRNRGLVESLQGGSCGGIGTATTGGRNNAHLGTCIHQEP